MSAATITVAEVEELVEAGMLDPNQIHIPEYSCNVFSRFKIRKRIEQRTVRIR
jgi:3-oxoacid CoA-transferase subunit A